MQPNEIAKFIEETGPDFNLAPFAERMDPLIKESLEEHSKSKWRKGTKLLPQVSVWLVLALTIRRDLNCEQVLHWMLSGFRWLGEQLPPKANLVAGGTISHARVALGAEVFQTLFRKLSNSLPELKADFFGRITCIFDGSTGTMPDSPSNVKEFYKTKNQTGECAFPQLRMMAIVALSMRVVLDIAYGPYQGKGTGERSLMTQLLERICRDGLLFVMDAGLYSFELVWLIRKEQKNDFLLKLSSSLKPKFVKQLPDGSFLAQIEKKVIDTDAPPYPSGRQRKKVLSMVVRVIHVQIPGFRPFYLMTSILDEACTALDLARHYHQRWDIEISYDEIKTHQCATRRGQSPTLFRSKRPDLVKQELFAIMITYNLVRLLIFQSATEQRKDPRFISFLDTLHHLISAIPMLTYKAASMATSSFAYLYSLIADSDIDRPRRPRTSPRVVRIRRSKFLRKNQIHKTTIRHYNDEIEILQRPSNTQQQNLTPTLQPT